MDFRLAPGDVFLIGTSGGGGLGNALDRDPAAVARDVVQGRVSVAHAYDAYGVVVDDAGVIDEAATAARRAELRAATAGAARAGAAR